MATLAIFTIALDDGSTITLSADQQAAPFYGYHLIDYGPQIGALSVARNGSPYVDGSRIVNQRSENIVEQYRMDIVGTSPDDAMAKLAALYQLVYWARDRSIDPNWRTPPGIVYAIPGTTRSGFAYIVNGSVSESSQTPRMNIEGNRIKGVILTLERTRWYKATGNAPTVTTYKATGSVAPWGVIAADGSAAPEVMGDVPARVSLAFECIGGSSIGRIVCGYYSQQRMRGGYTSPAVPTTPFLLEAESATRVNFTAGASALASPGGAGNTYVVNSAASGSLVATASLIGRWRVFARIQSSGVSSIALTTQNTSGVTPTTFPAVAIPNTGGQWRMYDLGVVSTPTVPTLSISGTFTENTTFTFNTTTSSGSLFVDCFILIPCGEYYLDMKLNTSLVAAGPVARYNNAVIPTAVGAYVNPASTFGMYTPTQFSGEILLPPGQGTFYYLVGNASFANTLTPTGNINFGMGVAYQYDTAPAS